MAEYSNLTSFEGLVAGDIVTYTANTIVDTKGAKFKAELYAGSSGNSSKSGKGGKTIATVDASILSNKIISIIFYERSPSISYGEFSDYDSCLYYRFLVAGAGGGYGSSSTTSEAKSGTGGGSSGGVGGTSSLYGATQTSGGYYSGSSSSYSGHKGKFGYGGTPTSGKYGGSGGAGWYGGGATGTIISSYGLGGSGGSGFIIGKTTTTYPAGYLGDDTNLQATLASAISDASTTTGGGVYQNTLTATTVRTKITIIEEGGPSTSIVTVDVSEAQDGSVIMELTPTEADPSIYDAVVKQAEGSTNTVWYQNIDTYEATIKTLTIADGITQIPSGIFNFENEGTPILDSITFGNTLLSIPNNCFRRISSLTSVEIPGNIKTIGDLCFNSCENLSSVILNEGLISLGKGSFGVVILRNSSLNEITLPASLTTLGIDASSFNVKNIYVASGSINFKSVDGVLYSYDGKTAIKYPMNRDEDDNEYSVLDGTEILGEYFTYSANNIRIINIPSSLKEIKKWGLSTSGTANINMTERKFYNSVTIEEYGLDSNLVLKFKLPDLPRFQYYKDTKFRDSTTYYYDGSKFIKVEPYIYNNGNFDPQ